MVIPKVSIFAIVILPEHEKPLLPSVEHGVCQKRKKADFCGFVYGSLRSRAEAGCSVPDRNVHSRTQFGHLGTFVVCALRK